MTTEEEKTSNDEIKDLIYIIHDANASEDDKMYLLFESLGCEGYGIYWLLIEALRKKRPTYKLSLAIAPGFARRYCTTADKVNSVIHSFSLFEVNEKEDVFYSLSLCRRMEKMDKKRMQAIEAGKLSALKRKELNGRSTVVERSLNDRSTTVQPEKKSNVKKSNVIKEYSPVSDERILVDIFLNNLIELKPNIKKPTDKQLTNWCDDMDKILRLDQRTFKQVQDVITKLKSNTFWSGVCLSISSLRKHFDQIEGIDKPKQLTTKETPIANIDTCKKYIVAKANAKGVYFCENQWSCEVTKNGGQCIKNQVIKIVKEEKGIE